MLRQIPRIPRENVTPEIPVFLHPPRTGGQARGVALRNAALEGKVYLAPHGTRAGDFPINDVVAFVREPFERYLSVYARFQTSLPRGVSPAEAMTLDKSTHGMFWLARQNQCFWLNAPHVRMFRLQDMELILPKLAKEYSIGFEGLPEPDDPSRNESKHRITVSKEEEAYIRRFYPEDKQMWERLHVFEGMDLGK